ncbi:3-deoxy-D-manno-octulosonic acid transferase [Pedobacter sp. GR22-6]|uniref:3-deoxy-D-manno-octulosonic acid transferase n=1 Tax=Pedobacter sp. GR22-6 TaxID=3127957 RepID=UPI00307ED7EC
MLWLYNIGIHFYGFLVRIFSLFNSKAALFVKGRKHIFSEIQNELSEGQFHTWFHFASLGEFEQGRPVLEQLKAQRPELKIVITFFSPSGYEIRKDYPLAEGVFYLPLDTPANARKLVQLIRPDMAIFTKYEYWYHYFKELHQQQVPIYIISGIFRPNQIFFKWYGGLNRKILNYVRHFFVQNMESRSLLAGIGLNNVSISGDTRFDRVAAHAASAKPLDIVAQFCQGKKTLIAGSSWPADEQLLKGLMDKNSDWKLIVAPHEISKTHLEEIERLFPNSERYSAPTVQLTEARVLIIDNIGLLSSIYPYGQIAYIGGGFGVGIHNTLEAAAFGLPVLFGPNYQRFQEAKDLIEIGAAVSISNQKELNEAFTKLKKDSQPGILAQKYVQDKTGATGQILQMILS